MSRGSKRWLFSAAVGMALTLPGALVAGGTGTPTASASESDDDSVQYDYDTGERITEAQGALGATDGFQPLARVVDNAYTYTVRLVASSRVEKYRPIVQDVVNELNAAGFAKLTVAAGQISGADVKKTVPLHEIYFDAAAQSPCAGRVAGCATTWQSYRATGSDFIAASAKIFVLPVVDSYSAIDKRHVVAHEFGHALGLDHFASTYKGFYQVMHPSSYDASTFQAGDRAGLAYLGRDIRPLGTIDSATVPAAGKVRVTGWAYDPDQYDAATVRLMIDGTAAKTKKTDVLREDVNKAKGLPAGTARGFDITVDASTGPHVVCMTALDVPRSDYAPIGTCRALTATGAIATDRIQGTDRYKTAAAVSRTVFPASAPVVVVASGESFADGLAAGPVASKLGGPLLLTQASKLPAATSAEISRLKPQTIVVAGGPSAIGDATVAQLQKLAKTVTRVGGADRYDTSRRLAAYAFPAASAIYVASGNAFPDALAAGAAAAVAGGPVLLVNGTAQSADAATLATVKAITPTRARVAGGSTVVADGILAGIKSLVTDTRRVSGSDRYSTAVAISADAFPNKVDRASVASGLDFPDGMVSAPLAARGGSPVYLSNGTCLTRQVLGELSRLDAKKLTLLGSTGVLAASVASVQICD